MTKRYLPSSLGAHPATMEGIVSSFELIISTPNALRAGTSGHGHVKKHRAFTLCFAGLPASCRELPSAHARELTAGGRQAWKTQGKRAMYWDLPDGMTTAISCALSRTVMLDVQLYCDSHPYK